MNPQAKLYAAVIKLIRCPEFDQLVEQTNLIRFDEGNDNPDKDALTDADMVLVSVTDGGISANIFNSSSTSFATFTFNIVCLTGSWKWKEFVSQLNWIILCRLHAWGQELTQVTWKNRSLVKNVKITGQRSGSNNEDKMGPMGWTTAWVIAIETHIPISDHTIKE
jgi:hypothetical protein